MFGGKPPRTLRNPERWSNEAYRAPRTKPERWSSEEYHPSYARHLTVPEPTKYWRDYGKAKLPSPRGHIPRIPPRQRRTMFGGGLYKFNKLYLLLPAILIALTFYVHFYNPVDEVQKWILRVGGGVLALTGFITMALNVYNLDEFSISLILSGIIGLVSGFIFISIANREEVQNVIPFVVLSVISTILTFLQTIY